MIKHVLGIDPGKDGAIGHILIDGTAPSWIKMPSCPKALMAALNWDHTCTTAFVERAQAFHGQGVVSSFNYGMHYGAIVTLLDVLHIPTRFIRPHVWTADIHARFGANISDGPKAKSLACARRRFPDMIFQSARGRIYDGAVDALLLAEHGRIQLRVEGEIV